MDKIVIANGANIIGRRGENEAVRLLFPIAPWREQFGSGGSFQLVAQRHNDAAPYPVAIEVDDRYVYWTVNAADTAVVGNGTCELYYYVDDTLAKSVIYTTLVFESMDEPGEAPEPQVAWLEQVLGYATDAEIAAVDAAASADAAAGSAASAAESASYTPHPPVIGVNENWWLWNGTAYADSGLPSRGATGPTGETGATGNGIAVIEQTSTSGLVDTYTITFTNGTTTTFTVTNGEDGEDGAPGAAAGFGTPTATVDGNVGTPSVTVTASGPDTAKIFAFAFANLKGQTGETGATGNGIQSIEKTGSSGLLDTYTITYTNGNTDTFTVTNGEEGQDGDAAGFGTPTATVDGNVGTPGVTVTASGPDTAKIFAFAFTNLKGETGQTGQTGQTGATGNGIQSITKTGSSGNTDTYTILYTNGDTDTFAVTNGAPGQDGAAAGFGTPTATVDSSVGTPGVTVTASGPDTAKVFAFAFTNLKGETGQTGATGATGNGIASIAKTGSSGLVDTYTITYTNGNTATFTVTNGQDGAPGPNTVTTSTTTNLNGILKGNGSAVSAIADGSTGQVLKMGSSGPEWGAAPTTVNPYTSTPAMDGTGSAGSSADYSRGDHVHPSQIVPITKYDYSQLSPAQKAEDKAYFIIDDDEETLVFDNYPTAGSSNPVKSSGIKSALDAKADKNDLATIHQTSPTCTETNGIAAGVFFYLDNELVVAKTAIANGATFTNGTNYEPPTAGGLNALKSAIPLYITGSFNLTATTQFSVFSSSVFRFGNLVIVSIELITKSSISAAEHNIGSVSIAPSYRMCAAALLANNTTVCGGASIGPNGSVYLNITAGSSKNIAFSAVGVIT